MKIKLCVSEIRIPLLKRFFEEKGIETGDDADFILTERNQFAEYLNAKQNAALYRIPVKDIVFIESYGKNIILHTKDAQYNLTERLKELESLLDPEQFLRISNSVIIAHNSIKKIQPTLGQKFILTLTEASTVDVTRSYYYIFREKFGI